MRDPFIDRERAQSPGRDNQPQARQGENAITTVRKDVRSALSDAPLVILSPEQKVSEAAEVLSSHEIGAAPVLDAGRLVGVFSERDVLQRIVAVGRDPTATLVGEVMTREPKTISADGSLVKAFVMMTAGKFRHLPVIEDGNVMAMLSMRDISPE